MSTINKHKKLSKKEQHIQKRTAKLNEQNEGSLFNINAFDDKNLDNILDQDISIANDHVREERCS